MNLRFLIPTLPAVMLFAAEVTLAEMKPGSSAILTTSTPLSMNGKTLRDLDAGQAVTILGEKAATAEAVVSVQLPSGEKLVGILPQAVIVVVDGSGTAAPPPASTPAPVLQPDLKQKVEAIQVAEFFKRDREAAKTHFFGQRVKLGGTLEKALLETQATGGEKIPVLFYKTAKGLPLVEVRLSPTVATGDAFFQKFKNQLPDWWWGSAGRSIEFRLLGVDRVQARASYNLKYQTSIAGGSYTTRNKSNTEWFTIFAPDEYIEVDASFHGLYMDIEFSGGLISPPK